MYLKFGSPNFVAMTRAQLGHYQIPVDLENLSEPDRQVFLSEVKILSENKTLKRVMDMVINDAKERICKTVDNELQLFCERFTINGVEEVREKLDYFSSQEQPNENYDPHEIV